MIEVWVPGSPREARGAGAAAAAAVARGARAVIVDLSNVPAPGGGELDALVAARLDCEKAGASLHLAGASKAVKVAIATLGLQAIFPRGFETVAEARAEVEGEPQIEFE